MWVSVCALCVKGICKCFKFIFFIRKKENHKQYLFFFFCILGRKGIFTTYTILKIMISTLCIMCFYLDLFHIRNRKIYSFVVVQGRVDVVHRHIVTWPAVLLLWLLTYPSTLPIITWYKDTHRGKNEFRQLIFLIEVQIRRVSLYHLI